MKFVTPGVYSAACLSYDTVQCCNVCTYCVWTLFFAYHCRFIYDICTTYCTFL